MSGTWIENYQQLSKELYEYFESGGSIKSLSKKSGVSRLTLTRWAQRPAPQTIEIADRIEAALNANK